MPIPARLWVSYRGSTINLPGDGLKDLPVGGCAAGLMRLLYVRAALPPINKTGEVGNEIPRRMICRRY
jgi:hypothetical protein